MLEALLAAGADRDLFWNDLTPLRLAVKQGVLDNAKFLLEANVSVAPGVVSSTTTGRAHSRESSRKHVDLPLPLRPTSAVVPPAGALKVASTSAGALAFG